MIGHDELMRVIERPPVDMDALGIIDHDDATDEQQADIYHALKRFWLDEGVDYEAIVNWAETASHVTTRMSLAGVAITPEELDEVEENFTAAHLAGFTVGWMMARGMGSQSNEEEEDDGN